MYRILTARELTRLGFSHRDIRMARGCCLRRLSRGVYLVSHVCDSAAHRPLWASIEEKVHAEFIEYGDNRDRVAELNACVMARCETRFQQTQSGNQPPDEVFSHISAAVIHGLPVAYPVTHQVEVVRPGTNRRFKSIHVRGGRIPAHHRQRVRGTEVTTLERTLVDVARSYNLDIAVAMLDDALHRGLTTEEKVRATFAQCLETRNSTKVSLALALADALRESPAESLAAVRFYQHGISGMSPQVVFDADALHTTIRVDFCHRAAHLIVEIDGLGKLYLGSGVPRTELERERRREQWLRDRGWRVIRISWKELFTEAKFAEIKRLVESALAETMPAGADAAPHR